VATDPAMKAARKRPDAWNGLGEARMATIAAGLAVLAGVMVSRGLAIHLMVFAGLLGGLLFGLADWRRSIYGLLIYLPFSGIPIVLLYPHVIPALLAKDLLFIIPAYVGFLAKQIANRRPISYGGAPIWPLTAFAVLVIAQVFNPDLPSRLVGAIGAKVWLFYIPLCFLGYHLVNDRRDLHRLLGVISIVAVLPALIGISEALLIYAGQEDIVYRAYGPAAAATTQNFARFQFAGGGTLLRIPSTFSFGGQYFSFTAVMVAVTYAWWRGALSRTPAAALGMVLWIVLLLAAFLSGARGAFLSIPFLVMLMVFLDRQGKLVPLRWAVAPVAFLACSTVVMRASTASVLQHTMETLGQEFGDLVLNGFRNAVSLTLFGLGTGINTNAARYAFPQVGQFQFVNGTWYENWYVKVLLELGLPGLILLVVSMATIVIGMFRRHHHLRDTQLRAVSASLLALVVWNLLYSVKGGFIDIDPMNVYFWLFVGVMAKIPVLDRIPPEASHGAACE
jgi:hypothetical protein